MIKNSKGITLVSLMITIVLMLIISSITISVSMDRFEINDYNKMINDLKLLEDKVSNYYLKYNAIPIVRDKDNNPILYDNTKITFDTNKNDNGVYYILDLSAMEGISLNYGEEFENKNYSSDDVYIINEKSHQIYYVKGVELKGITYHTILDNNTISDNIPPSKPSVKVVSGTLNHDGTYISEVELEFVPGKSEGKKADKTEYSLDGGNTWENTNILTNNIYKITDDGTYNICVRSYDEQQNVSDEYRTQIVTAIPSIGDKVEYNEGIGYSSNIDTNFVMKDMKWRILDIEEDGTIELIRTPPTDSTLTLSKAQGWLEGVENLDTLCNDLYGNGTDSQGNRIVKQARSLKVEDINKLAKYNPSTYTNYGEKWQYRFSTETGYMQYRKSIDDGKTWNPDWTNIENTKYQRFLEPGQDTINSSNTSRIVNVTTNLYAYSIESKVTTLTRDNLSMGKIITQGEIDNVISGTNYNQWLSSNAELGTTLNATFYMRIISDGKILYTTLQTSYGEAYSPSYVVRPVVTLNNDIKLTKVNDVWQISK